jgi:hypothetical protein
VEGFRREPAGASMGGGLSAKNGLDLPSFERFGAAELKYVYEPTAIAMRATTAAA